MLGLHALTAKGPGSIPGWGTKTPQAVQRGQKIFLIKKNPRKQNSSPVHILTKTCQAYLSGSVVSDCAREVFAKSGW